MQAHKQAAFEKSQHVDGNLSAVDKSGILPKKTHTHSVAAALNRLQLIKPLIVSDEFLVVAAGSTGLLICHHS